MWLPRHIPKVTPPWTLLEAQRAKRVQAATNITPATALPRKRLKAKWGLTALAFGLLVIAGIFALLVTRPKPAPPEQALGEKVAKLAGLSPEPNPAVIGVVDASKVNQPFLKEAQTGDQVVLYYIAHKAVIYRPSTGKVVKAGAFEPPLPKVFIRKGAADADVDGVKGKIAEPRTYNFTSTDESPQPGYQGITVVDISKRYPDQVHKITADVKGTVTALPSGETPPDADILLIIGSGT
jgi:hypothetical protein